MTENKENMTVETKEEKVEEKKSFGTKVKEAGTKAMPKIKKALKYIVAGAVGFGIKAFLDRDKTTYVADDDLLPEESNNDVTED